MDYQIKQLLMNYGRHYKMKKKETITEKIFSLAGKTLAYIVLGLGFLVILVITKY